MENVQYTRNQQILFWISNLLYIYDFSTKSDWLEEKKIIKTDRQAQSELQTK